VTSTDQNTVRHLTHTQGPNFSVGFRFLSSAKRRAVYAAYAVCRVADDIVDEVAPGADSEDARGRLDAWEAEIEAAYVGRPHHPVTRALAESLDRFAVPKEAFFGLIEGCRMDLVKHRYADFTELEHYCELVAVTISDISLAIFGVLDRAATSYGRDLALALQLTNICRDVGEDTERGRIYLPLDELERFRVTEEQLFARNGDAPFRELMAFQTARARDHFHAANPLPQTLERDARLGVRLMGLVYARILARIAAEPEQVLHSRVALHGPDRARVILAGVLRRPFVR
jgi:15-cis-phytoene synthase